MKASIFVAVSGAAAALAGPVNKRAMDIEYTTEIVYVTVTEGEPYPTVAPSPTMYMAGEHKYPTTSCETSTTAPAAPTYAPAPPPAQTPKAQPQQPQYPAQNVPAAGDDYNSQVIYHHNIHRSNHSAPAASWSDKYAGYAAQTAKSCVFKHNLTPGGGGYGQNIAMYASSNAKSMSAAKAGAQAITNMWYNGELNKFPHSSYGKSSPDMSGFEKWGHFSQVVWSGSTQIGCATQYCPPGTMMGGMGSWYTVCDYYPAGNMGGAYGSNVHPPQGQPGVSA